MNIIVTGSLGNISKPLTKELVEKGHLVTVISRKPEKQKDIEALGARAAIGYIQDVKFLSTTFTGADAVYCIEPPHNPDLTAEKLAHNYVHAIQQSGVKRLINLSSIGAHTDKGNGILAFYYNMETILKKLPSDVAITFVRPGGFYYNLLRFIDTIKTQGVIASNYGGDDKIPWVSPIDIAAAVAEELVTPFAGRKVRYVVSDELTCDEVATILGTAIGKPDLKWIVIPDEQMQSRLIAAGFSAWLAAGFVEMNASTHSGQLFEDYYRNRPMLGKVKMKDFAKEFASIYTQK
jgi:uncharacterized protein YbjT (DUF2867 family)